MWELAKRLSLAACLLALAGTNTCLALDPARTIAQFKHTGWTSEQGAPSYVQAITQSRDGFLWLGSGEGLFRFDGIAFEKISPLATKPARSESVTALLGASTGDVWVGHYWGGVSVYRNGKLMDANPAPPTGGVQRIAEDKFGAIWIWSEGSHFASLRRYAGGKWTILDRSWGLPRAHLSDILVARNGDLWLGYDHQLAILRHGTRHLEWIDEQVGAAPGFAELSNGEFLVADTANIRLLPADIRSAPKPFLGVAQTEFGNAKIKTILVDRDNSLWLRNPAGNLERIAHPRELPAGGIPTDRASTDIYARKPGLSADQPLAIFEDREGNIWTGTEAGLDRYRSMNIVPVLGLSDYPGGRILTMVGSNSGRVYGLAYEDGKARPFEVEPGNIVETVQPAQSLANPLCASRDGGAWFLGVRQNEFFHVREGSVAKIAVPEVDTSDFHPCVETDDGRLWIVQAGTVPLEYNGTSWKNFKMGAAQNDVPWSMGPDGHGGVLMYVALKYLVDVRNDSVRILWRQKDIPLGLINVITAGPNAALLGGANGLARYDGKSIRVLGADQFPVLSQIVGIAQTRRGQIWILTPHRLIAMSSSELDAAFDHPGRVPHYRVFDFRDGFSGSACEFLINHLAVAADGRIWLLTSEGYFWIDPKNLYSNTLPPPVAIRSLTADGVVHPAVQSIMLPNGTSNLEVDYSVLSLQTPERNAARYKLDGVDKTWIDAGARRQAFYTNLGPGTYAFHVIASNDDGVWNRTGQSLAIVIPPTFLQSDLFRVLCVLGGVFVLWALYQLRMQQLAAHYRGRLLERLSERERIARELHDTLLQGVQGLILRFQAVADQIASGKPSLQFVEGAIQRAESVLVEGRDRVKQLRLADRDANLPALFEETGKELASGGGVNFSVSTEGTVRELHPVVRDEVAGIGSEAMINAFNHANAKHIVLVISYGRSRFSMCVRDDGRGIDAKILASGGRERHFGLQGMRERAQKIGADLSLSSGRGQGTEIGLTVPGHIAYASTRKTGFRYVFRRFSIDDE